MQTLLFWRANVDKSGQKELNLPISLESSEARRGDFKDGCTVHAVAAEITAEQQTGPLIPFQCASQPPVPVECVIGPQTERPITTGRLVIVGLASAAGKNVLEDIIPFFLNPAVQGAGVQGNFRRDAVTHFGLQASTDTFLVVVFRPEH